jgi:hypothetical protein
MNLKIKMRKRHSVKNIKITCSRFNNEINFDVKTKIKRARIGSNSITSISPKDYTLISTDGVNIYSSHGAKSIRDFFTNGINKPLMVLTNTERNLLHSMSIETENKVYVFEILFPIFNDIKYIPNISRSYNYLLFLFSKIKSGETNGIPLGKYYSTKNLYKTERKLKIKNNLDVFFAHAYKSGYQEVFKLKEERENRTIIALDFNSMFASCMLEKFMEPKSLKFINPLDIDHYDDALLHITLSNPVNDFIKNYHPFKYTRLFRKHTFKLGDDHSIETVLFKDEFLYYKEYFHHYKIHGAISSSKMIKHPLYDDIKKLYQKRIKANSEDDKFSSNLLKFMLSSMHSCTNTKKYIHLNKKTKSEIKGYIEDKFLLRLEETNELELVKGYHGINIREYNNLYNAKIVNLESLSNIHSLSSRITSRAELKMLKTIQILTDFKSLEICYCNIDSIHISIESEHFYEFFNKFQYLIGSEIGKLKVEAIAEQGYWFDPGRYWLAKDKKITKFANILFNNPGKSEPFIFNTKIYYHVKGSIISYSSEVFKNVFSAFNYSKALDIDSGDFSRYDYREVKNLNVAKKTYQKERDASMRCKTNLIKSLPFKF